MSHFDPSRDLSKQARHRRAATRESADCGPLDGSRRDVQRWGRCRNSLLEFLVSYFPATTGLRPFSEDHKRVIARIEGCILSGGRYANVVFRGFGKTTLSENAALWATLYGHRRFVPIFAANDRAARGIIRSIKRELQENDLLADDFFEICTPIRALENKSQRCATQTCDGLPTFVEWTADRIVLPSVPGAEGGGAILAAHGLTSGTLGMKHKRADGVQQRPDFVLIDDPQSRDSAASPAQVQKRREIITASILKMAGHRTQIACVVNGTVIQPDDLMDELLDHKKSSAWQSERIPMVRKWADAHETLWLGQYADLRRGFDPERVGDQQRAHLAANEFYSAHREEMDRGCEVSWEWCYVEDTGDANQVPELSAIQHAYNSLIDDGESVFASECQCQPIKPGEKDSPAATQAQIEAKIVAVPRGVVPQTCERLTAAVDIGGKLLWWIVVAWRADFTGHVVDFGAYPDQKRPYFTNADAKRTIRQAHPGTGEEGALTAALEQLVPALLAHEWKRADGTPMKIERAIVDANWSTDVVYSWLAGSSCNALALPSHGKFFGASSQRLISDYKLDPGERRGPGWLLGRGQARQKLRHLLIDSNYAKSFIHKRLVTATGDKGSLTLFHDADGQRLLIDHCTAEICTIVKSHIRTAEEWKAKPGRDNHLLDALSLTGIAASIQGCALSGEGVKALAPRKPRMTLQAMASRGR